MTVFRRGDVVLVRFPNSDLVTYRKRPALVVQSESVATGIRQRIVAMITSNLSRTGVSRVDVPKDTSVGQQMGVLQDSVVVADNLATIREEQVDKRIGHCTIMGQVDTALRAILGL